MKFIHAADLHLGSAIGVPTFGETKPALALWNAFDRLIEACLSEAVDFILFAGDTFDSERVSQQDRKKFSDCLGRLSAAQIPVYLIHGNHDPLTAEFAFLESIEGLHVCTADKAVTFELKNLGVAIHGQSFHKGPIDQNLSLAYPAALEGCYNIGMLHTSLSVDGDHARYAPCSLADLTAKNYDYWALGHIHTARVFNTAPWVGFCGNIQGRNVKEQGAKGVNLVLVEDGTTIVELLDLAQFEYEILKLKLSEDDTFETVKSQAVAMIDAAQADKALVYRLVVSCPTNLFVSLQQKQQELLEGVRIDSIKIGTGSAYLKDLRFYQYDLPEALNLPFDIDFDLRDNLFDDLSKSFSSHSLSIPELDPEELKDFVLADLSVLEVEK
ncbi:MAG: metallophosphoesterase family protein [Alphaproteobacteria bacterium]